LDAGSDGRLSRFCAALVGEKVADHQISNLNLVAPVSAFSPFDLLTF